MFTLSAPFPLQGLNETEASITCYREVLKTDSTNIEAIACVGTHHFYNDQPEIAVRYYRWVGCYGNQVSIWYREGSFVHKLFGDVG